MRSVRRARVQRYDKSNHFGWLNIFQYSSIWQCDDAAYQRISLNHISRMSMELETRRDNLNFMNFLCSPFWVGSTHELSTFSHANSFYSETVMWWNLSKISSWFPIYWCDALTWIQIAQQSLSREFSSFWWAVNVFFMSLLRPQSSSSWSPRGDVGRIKCELQ